jgi:hypothetical protein
MKDSSYTAITSAPVPTDWPDSTCLGRTCLKWGSDGELTTVDLLLVLERLAQVDQEVTCTSAGGIWTEGGPAHLDPADHSR